MAKLNNIKWFWFKRSYIYLFYLTFLHRLFYCNYFFFLFFLHHRFNIFFLFRPNMLLSIFYFYFSLFCFQFQKCFLNRFNCRFECFYFLVQILLHVLPPHHPFKTYILPITFIILLVYSFSIPFFQKKKGVFRNRKTPFTHFFLFKTLLTITPIQAPIIAGTIHPTPSV
ncbi:hypothetical protein protein [Bacillus cereus G9241]|nr:hypothetical protein protein [Bacillus cereus G9241]